MTNVWFTGDTHFNHANVIQHAARPFATLEEMDAALIANWNATVGPKDTVYHLGDFAWRDALTYRTQLNGNIHLIIGNTQMNRDLIFSAAFSWLKDVHMVKVGEQRVWLSHYAHRVWSRSHHGAWHCYGHSHGSLADDPHALSMDVGVDAAARLLGGVHYGQAAFYRPLSFDEVAAHMAKKEWRPVDHHGDEDCGP